MVALQVECEVLSYITHNLLNFKHPSCEIYGSLICYTCISSLPMMKHCCTSCTLQVISLYHSIHKTHTVI